jgi:hypothetical protein
MVELKAKCNSVEASHHSFKLLRLNTTHHLPSGIFHMLQETKSRKLSFMIPGTLCRIQYYGKRGAYDHAPWKKKSKKKQFPGLDTILLDDLIRENEISGPS